MARSRNLLRCFPYSHPYSGVHLVVPTNANKGYGLDEDYSQHRSRPSAHQTKDHTVSFDSFLIDVGYNCVDNDCRFEQYECD